MFQCTLSVLVDGGVLVLPAGVLVTGNSTSSGTPGSGPCVVLNFSELQLQMRLHDYFFGGCILYYGLFAFTLIQF